MNVVSYSLDMPSAARHVSVCVKASYVLFFVFYALPSWIVGVDAGLQGCVR